MKFVFFLIFLPLHLFANWDPLLVGEEAFPIGKENEELMNLRRKVNKQITNGWCSELEAKLIMELAFTIKPEICVEVGTFDGSYFLPIAATLAYLNQGHAFAINPWSNDLAIKGVSHDDVNYNWWKNVNMEGMKNQVDRMIRNWSLFPYCTIIQEPFETALSKIESIDFLHLLGGLSEEESLRTVTLYLPKVRSGGYILISNVFLYVDKKLTRMKALWALMDACEIICEIDNSNAILFKKV